MLKSVVLMFLVALVEAATPRNHLQGLEGRIVGGSAANILKHSYQVSVQVSGNHICGGSIIGDRTVLTAAHCKIADVNKYRIRAGSNVTVSGGSVYNVTKFLLHPNYNNKNDDYDYAVITVDKAFNDTYHRIPLHCGSDPINSDAVVTGWGTKYTSSSLLQQLSVRIENRTICNVSYDGDITDRMICARDPTGRGDACQGDSGGPLVVNGKLVGVVSWGYSCVRPVYPGVYSRVSDQCNWIHKNSSIKQTVTMSVFAFLLITILTCVSSSTFAM